MHITAYLPGEQDAKRVIIQITTETLRAIRAARALMAPFTAKHGGKIFIEHRNQQTIHLLRDTMDDETYSSPLAALILFPQDPFAASTLPDFAAQESKFLETHRPLLLESEPAHTSLIIGPDFISIACSELFGEILESTDISHLIDRHL